MAIFRDMYCCETFKAEEITIQKSRSGSSFQCHEEIWRTQVLRTLFENAQYLWAIIEWQNNKSRAKPIILETKSAMLCHFKLETACHEETWDLFSDEDYQLLNNLLSEKCPIIMNNLLNGNF